MSRNVVQELHDLVRHVGKRRFLRAVLCLARIRFRHELPPETSTELAAYRGPCEWTVVLDCDGYKAGTEVLYARADRWILLGQKLIEKSTQLRSWAVLDLEDGDEESFDRTMSKHQRMLRLVDLGHKRVRSLITRKKHLVDQVQAERIALLDRAPSTVRDLARSTRRFVGLVLKIWRKTRRPR